MSGAADFHEIAPSRSVEEQAEDAWWVSFGANVRLARKARGLTQEDLADSLGFARSSVANIELGRQRPNAYFAARLVAELGMTVPGWTVDTTSTVLARQLIQARGALMDVLGHLRDAQTSARGGLT